MTIEGTVRNGVVVLEGTARPPEGARVRVELIESKRDENAASGVGRRMLKYAGRAVGLPSDMADNHDHYLHGTRKR
jgi:hypothetical protein